MLSSNDHVKEQDEFTEAKGETDEPQQQTSMFAFSFREKNKRIQGRFEDNSVIYLTGTFLDCTFFITRILIIPMVLLSFFSIHIL